MKKLFTFLVAFVCISSAFTQSPERMSYQAVVRNGSNQLVTNKEVGIKISILQGTPTGTIVYQEIYNPNPQTNANGLVSIEIGGGIPISGSLSEIIWATSPYFLKSEIDPTGGSNYTISGTSQLLSVPYALYAKTAENGFSGNYNDLSNIPTTDGSETKVISGTNVTLTGTGTTESPYVINSSAGFTHYIGELYGGGIVVSVWKVNGAQRGLIASLVDLVSDNADLGPDVEWSNVYTLLGTANNPRDGQANTIAIMGQDGHTSSAASLCDAYISGSYNDWYLPSLWELNQCYEAATIVNEVLGDTNGFQQRDYWSSNEGGNAGGYCLYFYTGITYTLGKSTRCRVRAVRRF